MCADQSPVGVELKIITSYRRPIVVQLSDIAELNYSSWRSGNIVRRIVRTQAVPPVPTSPSVSAQNIAAQRPSPVSSVVLASWPTEPSHLVHHEVYLSSRFEYRPPGLAIGHVAEMVD